MVCDKKAAIAQVEERLTKCDLKPALLNLHDEDLDKREFLRQATEKYPTDIFAGGGAPANYPFEQLRETRKTLNERVRFGEAIAHPLIALGIAHRDSDAAFLFSPKHTARDEER